MSRRLEQGVTKRQNERPRQTERLSPGQAFHAEIGDLLLATIRDNPLNIEPVNRGGRTGFQVGLAVDSSNNLSGLPEWARGFLSAHEGEQDVPLNVTMSCVTDPLDKKVFHFPERRTIILGRGGRELRVTSYRSDQTGEANVVVAIDNHKREWSVHRSQKTLPWTSADTVGYWWVHPEEQGAVDALRGASNADLTILAKQVYDFAKNPSPVAQDAAEVVKAS